MGKTHRGLPPELAVAALVAAASAPLGRLFQPGRFGLVALLSLAVGLSVTAALRRSRVPSSLASLAAVAGLLWFAAVAFFPETLWGPFPTAASFRALGAAISDGARLASEEVAPVYPGDPLMLFVAAGVWTTAWLADTAAIGLRNPLLGIASTVPMFAAPGTLLPSQRRGVDVAVYLAAAAWVLFQDERMRARRYATAARAGWRGGAALRLGAAGAAVAILAAPHLPGYGETPGLRGRASGARVGFNPLVAIKPTLSADPDIVLFTVRTASPRYFRLTALERFDGKRWERRARPATRRVVPPDALDPGVPARPVTQDFEINALAGPWLPAAYRPVSVRGVGVVLHEPDTSAIMAPRGLFAGLRYHVVSDAPLLTREVLDRPVSYDRGAFRDLLALPRMPREVREIAERIAGDQPNAYRRALALQNWLRDTFTYDERVAAGHSFDSIVQFLTEVRRGYCEQFAASMAVLARALGIPSRVAIGFGLGDPTGPGAYEVRTASAHAWVEIYFPQAGWVAFEPTPRSGVASVPAYALPEPEPDAGSTPGPGEDETAAPDARGQDPRERGRDEGAVGGAQGALPFSPPALVGLASASAVAIALLCLLVLRVRTRARIRRAPTPREHVALAYRDFLGWCVAAGYGKRPGETPREHAERLGAAVEVARSSLEALAGVVEVALWAPPNGLDPSAADRGAAASRAALSEALPRRARLVAATGWGRWRGSGR